MITKPGTKIGVELLHKELKRHWEWRAVSAVPRWTHVCFDSVRRFAEKDARSLQLMERMGALIVVN